SALYGVDDLKLCLSFGIPFAHTVDLTGHFFPYVEKFNGMGVKDANPLIQHDLKERELLYKSETILHTYPECWRCSTSLIYYALDSWYVQTTKHKAELLFNNLNTNWVPAHVKTRHDTKLFEESFPADFISEALDQTRGWFYSLLAISTLLFKQNAYRNVICLGLVVDPKGQKHSKSRGNVLDPNYLFDTFGSDALRWHFYTAVPGGDNYRT